MHRLSPTSVNRLLLAAFFAFLTVPLLAQTSVRTVKVLNGKDSVEIEVEASDRIVPQTQVLTGPDRLVVDFPNAVPSAQLHSQSVDRGEVKDVRVGLFQHKPPVTRIVLDLKTAQSYQVFPYGRTIMIKVMSDAKVIGGPQDNSAGVDNFPPEPARRPGFVVANYTPGAQTSALKILPNPRSKFLFAMACLEFAPTWFRSRRSCSRSSSAPALIFPWPQAPSRKPSSPTLLPLPRPKCWRDC